jgi:pectinesterase
MRAGIIKLQNKAIVSAGILFILSFFCVNVYSASLHIKKDTSYTVYQTFTKVKKQFPNIQIVKPFTTNDVQAHKNLLYKSIVNENIKRQLHLDIFRPANIKKYPALIMVHGGGWRSGNKSMQEAMAQRIAQKGFVVVPVEYRLSDEAKYPAAIHDIKAAIRWMKDYANTYNIDTTKIAIEGESAGGQLATLVAMTNNVALFEGDKSGSKSSSTVHAAIDVDGVVDFLAPNSLNMPRKRESADVYWLGGYFEEVPLIWKEASPIFWVNKNSVPTLFIASGVPRFHAGRDEMIDLLNQNGIYSESHTITNSPHSFWLFDPWFDPTVKYIVNFLQKIF